MKTMSIVEQAKHMWFFHNGKLALLTTGTLLTFIILNVVILLDDYDFWIRVYQFVLTVVFLTTDALITYYWIGSRPKSGKLWTASNGDGPSTSHEDSSPKESKLLTVPLVFMTVIMGIGSILGYLYIIYFTTVFLGCDEATEAEAAWEIASDLMFFLVMMISFGIYPVFIFQCYSMPLTKVWQMVLYLVVGTTVALLFHISLEEAYHMYTHLCDNAYVMKNHWCPTSLERHQYKCTGENFTSIQNLWLESHEQIISPGLFLIIAEYIPLLFVLVWMVPVWDVSEMNFVSPLNAFKKQKDEDYEKPMMLRSKSKRNSAHADLADEANLEHTSPRKTVTYKPPSAAQTFIIVFCTSTFVLMLVRLGLVLNHVGRHPKNELLLEAVGHLIAALALSVMYGKNYFFWLRKWKVRAQKEADEHRLAHAKFDAFLLRIASVLITIQTIVSTIPEADFAGWSGPFYVVHKLPVLASIWLQYMAVAKAMTLEKVHWRTAGRRCALVFALVAVGVNFLEWVCQFVKRRFTEHILDTNTDIDGWVVGAIAISALLYPALSFYYFHALLCWLVVFWRVLTSKRDRFDEVDATRDHELTQMIQGLDFT